MIYFIVDVNIKQIIIEYCMSLIGKLHSAQIFYHPLDNIFNFEDENIYIFFGLAFTSYPKINKSNVYYVNLEQLTMNGSHSQYDMLSPIIEFAKTYQLSNILDYSAANVKILNTRGISSKYIPYQVNFDEIYSYDKIYDCVLCCSFNKRTADIYTLLSQEFPNSHFIGNPCLWGKNRDKVLFRSKLLINIHHRENDYNILEEIRITRCILNKIIIVSEYAQDYEKYPLAQYIIFTDYDNLVAKSIDVLNNYSNYYHAIFNDFDLNRIDKLLEGFIASVIKSGSD